MTNSKKVLYCPDCEKEFGGSDKIKVRGGLILCPNCEVELKPIEINPIIFNKSGGTD